MAHPWQAGVTGPGTLPHWQAWVTYQGVRVAVCRHEHREMNDAMTCARRIADQAQANDQTTPIDTL